MAGTRQQKQGIASEKRPRGRPRKDGQPAGCTPKPHDSTATSESGLSRAPGVCTRSRAATTILEKEPVLCDSLDQDKGGEKMDVDPLFDEAEGEVVTTLPACSSPAPVQVQLDTGGHGSNHSEEEEEEEEEEEQRPPPKKKAKKAAPKKPESDPIPDRKLSSMTLAEQSDWNGCVKDVRAHQNLLGGDDESADNEGAVDDEGGSVSLMELERQWGTRLQVKYGNCQQCGSNVMCKVGLDGEHHHLKHGQASAWSTALAQRVYGVTLDTPPKSDLFAAFHRNHATSSSSTMQSSSVLQPPPYVTTPDPGVTNTLMAATVAILAKSLGQKSPTKSPGGCSASSGTDLDYPSITSFIDQLHATHPHRNLDLYADSFGRHDLYNIDEIVDMTIEDLTSERFGLTFGNAKFLLNKTRNQVARIGARKL
ncbi:hypothetical protein V5O48_018061 [Marasmius crinis-equi]|uniref:SAM domain-containing protein n=1 Tax=Marasmius crinis-equi TaxID=585013 RepID=A0ABR3EMD7_9AGAR